MLKELHLKWVGPATKFDIEFGDRLNILTGDNGLGKSFILDVAWFALTATWANQIALPQTNRGDTPKITFRLGDEDLNGNQDFKQRDSEFLFHKHKWKDFQRPIEDSIIIYSQIEKGFSVFDPFRKFTPSEIYRFSTKALFDGLILGDSRIPCLGLIHDWVNWQRQPEQPTYKILCDVIQKLAHPNEPITIGEPQRITIDDAREIPIIKLPYGEVPITHASSGMTRILSLAYMLVWSWDEHLKIAALTKQKPLKQLVLLIDEVESHLHPQWQRSILPAILVVAQVLQPEMRTQIIATTHSPMVLASLEPYFDESLDKLFLFDLNGTEVTLNEVLWAKQGDADSWLTSDVFGLKRPRSREAEEAMEAAYTLMRGEAMDGFPEHLRSQEQIHQELLRVLPDRDSFWRRWVVTAE